jgi:hypothetical protein
MKTFALVLLASVAVAVPAKADNIKGKYATVSTQACLDASLGFDATFQALGVATSNSFSVLGIRTFDGNGGGSFVQRTMGVTVPPQAPGILSAASSTEGSGQFTYKITDDGIVIHPGPVSGKVLTGPRAGQDLTTTNIPDSFGLIGGSNSNNLLVSFFETPQVETLTYSDGTIIKRICHADTVYSKID